MRLLFLLAFLFSYTLYFGQIDSSRFFKTENDCVIYDLYYGNELSYDWSGSCVNGFAQGRGTCSVKIDSIELVRFIGYYDKGIAQGDFEILMLNKETYHCTFKDGRMMGVGDYKTEDGDHFHGEIRDFYFHGSGQLTYSNGAQFIGVFNKSQQWDGKFINLQNEITFIQNGEQVDKYLQNTIKPYQPKLKTELTEYFDENWKRCDKSTASFYRKITYISDNIPLDIVKDYYISGNIYRKQFLSYVNYTDEALNFKDAGEYITYYENGQVFREGAVNYRGNFCDVQKFYHSNGQLKISCDYNQFGKMSGERIEFDDQGKLTAYAKYSNDELNDGKYFLINKEGYWEHHYFEDFEAKFDFWNEEGPVNSFYYDDMLVVKSKKNESFYRTIPLNINAENQFNINLDLFVSRKNMKKSGIFGLIIDYQDGNNYFLFTLNNKNNAQLIQKLNGEYYEIASKKIQLVNNGDFYNLNFSMLNYYDGIKFMLNHELIHEEKTWQWKGSKYGLFLSGESTFFIENLGTIEFYDQENSNKFTNQVLNKMNNPDGIAGQFTGSGTGFFISRKGHVVTNYHVIEDSKQIFIQLNIDGQVKTYSAIPLINDKLNDLAILKIQEEFDLGFELPFNIDFSVRDVGTEVFTLGYPMIDVIGSEIKFTDGKISAKSGIEGDIRQYQITTPIQPGNSGGPLFDMNGNIVGIIQSTLNRENYNAENVNFAIKSTILKNLIDSAPEKILLGNNLNSSSQQLTMMIKKYNNCIPLILIK
jgi:hypothetical protein